MGSLFDWLGANKDIKIHIKTSDKCQCFKITDVNKYGKILLLTEAEMPALFDVARLDMIGPWNIKFSHGDNALTKEVKALRMMNRAKNQSMLVNCLKSSSYSATRAPRK